MPYENSYDMSKLVANVAEPQVYNTLIITLANAKEPVFKTFQTEEQVRAYAKMLVKDWKAQSKKASVKIVDDYNVMLTLDDEPKVLITCEFDVPAGTMQEMESNLKNWGFN